MRHPSRRWRMWERSSRRVLMWAAFAALSLFFIIPVAAVQVGAAGEGLAAGLATCSDPAGAVGLL